MYGAAKKNVTGKIIVRISRKIRVAEKFIKSIHLLSRRVFVIIVGTFNRICTRQIRSCGLTLQMHKFIFFHRYFRFGKSDGGHHEKEGFFHIPQHHLSGGLAGARHRIADLRRLYQDRPRELYAHARAHRSGRRHARPACRADSRLRVRTGHADQRRRRQRRVHLLSLFAATCPSRRSSALSKRSRRGWLQVTRIGSS